MTARECVGGRQKQGYSEQSLEDTAHPLGIINGTRYVNFVIVITGKEILKKLNGCRKQQKRSQVRREGCGELPVWLSCGGWLPVTVGW